MERPLVCTVCSTPYDGPTNRYVCPKCGGSIEPRLELNPDRTDLIEVLKKGSIHGIWDYRPFLPVAEDVEPVTMGEGGTPLVPAENLGKAYDLKHLYIKNETMNPTATYKDRFSTVDITLKKASGAAAVALGSAGNAGSSVAAYAARAGMPCYVLLPAGPVKSRAMQAMSYGARFIQSEGNIDDYLNVIEQGVDAFGWRNSCTTMLHNPLGAEGYKTIAYEIAKDLDFQTPDWILVPIGGGIILSKIWRGFMEMYELGLLDRLPKLAGVQAAGCAPVVKAMEERKRETDFWENSQTVAGSINDPLTFEGVTVLDCIRKSQGTAVAVSDEEIVEAMRLCAQKEAILAEPASAATLAAAKKLRTEGLLSEDDRVVCVVTGNGLRDLDLMVGEREAPPHIKARDLNACAEAIQRYESC